MAIAEVAVTETVSTTEWSFVTDSAGPDLNTDDAFVQASFDLSAMASGDEFRFRVYEKVQSGGSQLKWVDTTRIGPQSGPLVIPGLVLMHGWDITVLKVAGTDRSISGSIRKVT